MKLIKIAFFGLLGLWTGVALAAVQNPVTQMQQLTNTIQQDISQQDASLAKSPDKLFALIKQNVLPEVDVDRMAGMALGPKWRAATPQEKQQFIQAFGLTLTRVFANSLAQAANYKVTLYPLRNDNWQSAKKVAVNGVVTSSNSNQPSHITYYLERTGDSWKIYDFAVEGVSIVKNYQAQFQSFSDMGSLLARLDQINQGGQ
jgi:phospholipid transport system substrate-binding protein